MVFIETTIFTRDVGDILTDAEYAALQEHLIKRPDAGDVIRASGGLRKIRWKSEAKGKRGGSRSIYFWVKEDDIIYMLVIYTSRKDDLTPKETRALRQYIEKELA